MTVRDDSSRAATRVAQIIRTDSDLGRLVCISVSSLELPHGSDVLRSEPKSLLRVVVRIRRAAKPGSRVGKPDGQPMCRGVPGFRACDVSVRGRRKRFNPVTESGTEGPVL